MPNILELESGLPTYRAPGPRPVDTVRIFVRVGGYLRFDREQVDLRGVPVILSTDQALVLRRFLAKPNTCIRYAELFADVSARDHWSFIWKLKQKLVKALPQASIKNFRGVGYALILPNEESGSLPQGKARKPRWKNVRIQGQSIVFSPNAAAALKRLMRAGPGVAIPKMKLFAKVRSKYRVLREIRTKLKVAPGVEVRNVGKSYALFFKAVKPKGKGRRIQELKKKLEGIKLSRPHLAEIRACLLNASGAIVWGPQFPGGHASSTITREFRDLRDEVVREDSKFGPCFISRPGYLIDLTRYGQFS